MRTPTDGPGRSGRVILNSIIRSQYGQFDLVWRVGGTGFDGDHARSFGGQVNGLVGAASGEGVYIPLAHQYGPSAITIIVLDHEPALDEESWEEIVEVSVVVPDDAQPTWLRWGAPGEPLDLAPGTYRLRANQFGRDLAHGYPGDMDATDSYVIQLWPAPVRPDAIVKATSEDAAYLHRELGSHRYPAR